MISCEIVEDLLPLYADDCCSPESRSAVALHLADCPRCRAVLATMEKPLPVAEEKPQRPARVNLWKASLLQSALLFGAFGAITLGVAVEAGTPTGVGNGLIAFWLVIPATGFLLSLVNWYFVRLYPSRRRFVLASSCLTLLLTLLAHLWGLHHYEVGPELAFQWTLQLCGPGLAVTAALTSLSFGCANGFARLLGKE